MQHLALFDASIANGSALVQVAAVADPAVAPAGNGFLVPLGMTRIARVAAVGTNLTRVQLTSATLRDYAPFDINPVNVGTKIQSPARMVRFDEYPLELTMNEELDAFGVQSNAGAQRITVAVWLCDGVLKPVRARPFTIHWTASVTLAANAFTALTPTFDNGPPSGTFIVIGTRQLSAGALFHRLIPRGGNNAWRPGNFSYQGQDDYAHANDRYGDMGELMRFTNTTIPQIEVFSRSADTSQEGYLDMVQIG